jgi:hypothetical protein
LPVLFHLYLVESDAYDDLPWRGLVVTAVGAVVLGVGWAWVTGEIIAQSYAVAFQARMEFKQPLWEGIVIPVGGALMMLLPAVIARLMRVGTRESLDGFVIGAVGAMCFTAAATVTRLIPQFSTGLVSNNFGIASLLAEAGIRGVAMSVTAAAAGGMVGAALWFAKPDPAHQHEGQWLANPILAVVVVAVAYAIGGLADFSPLPETWTLAIYLVISLVMLLVLRLVLHIALLREAHDPVTQEPLLCEQCGHVVPDMSFCPACGLATRASSRSSRKARRADRPVRIEPQSEDS